MQKSPWSPHEQEGAARLLILPLTLFFLFFGCSSEEKPNILLITLDTVRADHIGCYGRKPGLTPAIDGLAGRGVRFKKAVAPAPITLPSHVSMLTGRDPVRHGVRDNSVYFLADDAVTLAEVLQDAGYRTGASVSSIALSHRF
jgi:choline-sulfatase